MSKKMVVALVLAMVMVFAFAGSAFAVWGDNTYLSTTFVGADSPHGDYLETTQKCGVCHAVHGAKGEKLLQSSPAGDSCTYCHITSAAYTTVYKGNTTLYSAESSRAHDMNAADGVFVECNDCHTIHGGGDITTAIGSTGNLKAYASQATTLPTSRTGAAYTGLAWFGTAPTTFGQWCAGCHPYYNTAYNGASHVMTSAKADYGVAGSIDGTRVAFAASTSCESCHDSDTNALLTAGGTYNAAKAGSPFPHATDGARFLTSRASYNTTSVGTAAANGSYDGTCLKCHTNGTEGVSSTF